MSQKFLVNNPEKAIFTYTDGFMFGDWILRVRASGFLSGNLLNEGKCKTGKHRAYDIEGDESPLMN